MGCGPGRFQAILAVFTRRIWCKLGINLGCYVPFTDKKDGMGHSI